MKRFFLHRNHKGRRSRAAFLLPKIYCAAIGILVLSAAIDATPPDSSALYRAWIVLRDKEAVATPPFISTRAAKRRRMVGTVLTPAQTVADAPMNARQVQRVAELSTHTVQVCKWINALSVEATARQLGQIEKLSFVKKIIPKRSTRRPLSIPATFDFSKKTASLYEADYGVSLNQNALVNLPLAQRVMRTRLGLTPGGANVAAGRDSSILIAVFDGGFWLTHRCFNHLLNRNAIVADSDFVDHDGDVADPDSVRTNRHSFYYKNEEHGSWVLAMIAGYDPPNYQGVAPGARFILARTEKQVGESHTEEDAWVAAMTWAESLGVDIVNSSLGYSNEFIDSVLILRDGVMHWVTDYTVDDMDGRTTIISLAARAAAARGVIIVSAAGNEGPLPQTISAPADVNEVVSVGGIYLNRSSVGSSSRGPTADGRIKPDLVALGSSPGLPNIYSSNRDAYWSTSAGTSFASPVVAGLCALTLQNHPSYNAVDVRNLLYASCSFVPGQTAVDNVFGRGVPDALKNCLQRDQWYASTKDRQGNALAGVAFVNSSGDTVAISDSSGLAIGRSDTLRLPDTLTLFSTLYRRSTIMVTHQFYDTALTLEPRLLLVVRVLKKNPDSTVLPIRNGVVWWQGGNQGRSKVLSDTNGIAWIVPEVPMTVTVTADANGFYRSSADTAFVNEERDTVDLLLQPRQADDLILYPTVCSRQAILARQLHLNIEFTAGPDEPLRYSQRVIITVRTVSGDLLYDWSGYGHELQPLQTAQQLPVQWNFCSKTGAVVAPGLYICTVQYAKKTTIRKIIVLE